jgi:DNA-binding NarL/FixJ family response regulator
MGPQATTVWIDDPNLVFRRGLVSCLGSEGLSVAGESAAFAPAPELDGVAVLLFDIEASGMQPAVEVTRGTATRLVGMVRAPSEEALFHAVQAGLAGFLVRGDLTARGLATCLTAVASGHSSLPPDLTANLLAEMDRRGKGQAAAPMPLARRELEVLRLLAEGGDTRAIATELNYSERTVKNIVHDVLMKTNCKTRAQAVALATRQGFI